MIMQIFNKLNIHCNSFRYLKLINHIMLAKIIMMNSFKQYTDKGHFIITLDTEIVFNYGIKPITSV